MSQTIPDFERTRTYQGYQLIQRAWAISYDFLFQPACGDYFLTDLHFGVQAATIMEVEKEGTVVEHGCRVFFF